MSSVATDDSLAGPPFDRRLIERPTLPTAGGRWSRFLEWSSTSAPVAVLLLAGMALGPNGIALLSPDTLSALAPAIPVGVAALGVLVALSVAIGKTGDRRLVLPACVDAVVTLAVVGVGMVAFARTESQPATGSWLVLITGAAVCAASALTLPTGNPLEPRPAAVRLIELGVVAPIVLGAGLLAWFHASSPLWALASIAQASGLICVLALAAWLLLTVASNATEERVLTVSALLLVGGVSDALSTSALFGGLVAGALWRYAGRRPLQSIARDVLFVQHPLVVGLLLTAGASADLSRTSLVYGAFYVVCRLVGRLAGGIAARRAGGVTRAADLGRHLLPPGIFGVVFALNATGILGRDASVLLGTVVVGTVGSEFVAFLLSTRRTAE